MIHTVLGEIDAGELGLTLMHEHVFMDLRHKFINAGLCQTDEPVTPESAPRLRKNHRLLKDNLFLGDERAAREELAIFKQSGGGAMVDMSCRGMGARPSALANLSAALGVHIVTCTGFYTQSTFPDYVKDMSQNDIAALFVRDLTAGIDDTGIRAGIIGEIGTSAQITPGEWKVLGAAAQAQRETGAAVSVHIDPWAVNGLLVISFLERAGADISRVVIGHTDAVINKEYCLGLLRAGCVIELDNFGKAYETPGLHFDTDSQRMEWVLELASLGWARSVLLSSDVCLKTDMLRFGGGGYGHIPRDIIPALSRAGLSDADIAAITVETPARLLSY